MSLEELTKMLNTYKSKDPRKAAEIAYVLARLYLEKQNNKKAIYFGQLCIKLFDGCTMETMEDCAARFVTLHGIALPSIIHQEVVRDRLRPLNI